MVHTSFSSISLRTFEISAVAVPQRLAKRAVTPLREIATRPAENPDPNIVMMYSLKIGIEAIRSVSVEIPLKRA